DVGGLQAHARELAHQIGLLGRQARAAQHGHGVRAVHFLNAANLRGRAPDRLIVADYAEPICGGRIARVGAKQPVGLRPLKIALDALGTEHAVIEWRFLPRLEADHAVRLDLKLDAALHSAKTAVSFHQAVRFAIRLPLRPVAVATVRAELLDNLLRCRRL